MILVDSSVWVDFFNGRDTPLVERLDGLLGTVPLAVGDLILTEVLQGFRTDIDYRRAREFFASLTLFELLGARRAILCAENYRALRKRGVPTRKTADLIIATFCISENHSFLYSDRDFDPFVEHLGLQAVSSR